MKFYNKNIIDMKFRHLALALFLGILSVAFPACNSSDEPGGGGTVYYTGIVTLSNIGANSTSFSFQEKNDSPTVTFTTQTRLNPEQFKEGERLVITYTSEVNFAETGYISAPITLLACSKAIGMGNAPESLTSQETQGWISSAVTNPDFWRTGRFINAAFLATTSTNPKQCRMVLDSSTASLEYPVLHLLFEPDITGPDVDTYVIYMSYSMQDFISSPDTKGVKIIYNDTESGAQSIVIDLKSNSGFTKPETK